MCALYEISISMPVDQGGFTGTLMHLYYLQVWLLSQENCYIFVTETRVFIICLLPRKKKADPDPLSRLYGSLSLLVRISNKIKLIKNKLSV